MPEPEHKKHSRRIPGLNKQAIKVTLIYLLFGFLWIMLTDKIAETVINNPSQFIMINIIKGLVYLTITGCLVYYLVSRVLKAEVAAKEKFVKINNELEHKNQLSAAPVFAAMSLMPSSIPCMRKTPRRSSIPKE
jgi:hypothetical protein